MTEATRRRHTLFRPCIDIHHGKVSQIVGGTLKDTKPEEVKVNFETEKDSAWFAKLYQGDKLYGGHVIKLGPQPENETAAIRALNAFPGGLQIGGGINPDNAMKYIDAGASHVIVTSYLFTGGQLDFAKLEKMRDAVGKKRLVVDVSCRRRGTDWFVATDRWQTVTSYAITKEHIAELENYCDEFLIHAADVEGLCKGIDTELVTALGQWVSIPTTYAGGAKSIEDLFLVDQLSNGKLDLTIGSAMDVFGGSGVKYADCIAYNNKAQGV